MKASSEPVYPAFSRPGVTEHGYCTIISHGLERPLAFDEFLTDAAW